jgi:hypothetical protein
MDLRFTVLASGSSGNATFVDAGGFGVLIDIGLGPRQLGSRLACAALSWTDVHAVLLTHTHSDHWKDRTFAQLQRRGVPLFCHPQHHVDLGELSPAFARLHSAGLVRPFVAGLPFDLSPGLRCRAFPLRHDGGATFGFRLEGGSDLFGRSSSLAYAADLGCWDDGLVGALADVDLLAIEFNHDVELEYASGRMPRLIARVLGDDGHLSNAQAADLVRSVLARSTEGRPRHLVQLHLSRDCNRPALARSACIAALADRSDVKIHTSEQDSTGATIHLGQDRASRRTRRLSHLRPATPTFTQLCLPGLGDAS